MTKKQFCGLFAPLLFLICFATQCMQAQQSSPNQKRELATKWLNQGNAKIVLGKYTEAIADLDQAVLEDPAFDDAYTSRGFSKNNLVHNACNFEHDILKSKF